MASTDEASRPLLGEHHQSSSYHYQTSTNRQSHSFEVSSESTPLLYHREEYTYGGLEAPPASPPAAPPEPEAASPESEVASPDENPKKPRKRLAWTAICGILAVSAIVTILVLAFIVPGVVKQYAREAAVFNPTNVSVESATSEGVKARVRGDVSFDANRVTRGPVRNLGRFVTWIGREVETGESDVNVYLPEYGNAHAGSASLPSIKLGIRNGNVNHLDFETDLVAENVEGLRSVAINWLDGKLERLLLQGSATLQPKSGLLRLGKQTVSDSIILEGKTPYLGLSNLY